ncbi:AsmA family protein [Jiella pelagia]|uniref:AsmA-like C-terminal domain-containing protein n=1 Tax=Jiella pelagia TaxID=2986949 RepID=A0ABY7BVP9_9HYPH|nr:AsmA-like C-terminal region-containing protein [Jiella pelagia]WAP67897.1 hypothetical protein OH818_21025 [Jiella pelagia]
MERLETLTGRNVSIDGRIDFSILPRARLSLENVRLGDDDFTIDTLVADFSLFDVIAGKGKISGLVLVRPEWRSPAEPDEVQLVSADPDGLLVGLNTMLGRLGGIGSVEIRDGLFRPAGRGFAGPRGVSNANVRIRQSGSGDTLGVAGSFVWNGQPTTVDLEISGDEPLVAGGQSNVDFSLDSPALTATYSGMVEVADLRRAEGRLSISTPSFTRGIEWLFAPSTRIPELGAVNLEGDLLLLGQTAELRQADLRIAGSQGRGAMEIRLEAGMPVIGGTLAFNDLNLTPIARSIAPYPRNPFDFERPLGVDFADLLEMEIRLSATELTLGTIPLQDVAAVISIGGGMAKLDIGDATLFGGRGQAAVAVDGSAGRPRVEGWISASDIDTARLMSSLSVRSIGLSGRSAIRAKLEAPAENWAAILSGIALTAQLDATDGTISGFDPGVFAEPGARPLTAGTRSGSIPFTALDAKLGLDGMIVDFDRVRISNSSGTLSAQGRYFAKSNEIEIAGEFAPDDAAASPVVAVPARRGAPPVGTRRIAFMMTGEWPNPSVTTEPVPTR